MLDPQTLPEVAAIEDTPSVSQGAVIASTLFEILSSLGVNVPLAHRVLRLQAGTVSGRNSLRRAAAALHAMATQKMDPGSNPTMPDIVAAAQWVATRYWGLSQQAQHDTSSSSNSETYADVSNIMKEICLTMEADNRVAQPDKKAASVRFTAASKSSIDAANAAGVDFSAAENRWLKGVPESISTPSTLPESSTISTTTAVAAAAAAAARDLAVESGVFDPVTRMFWKNYRARAVQQTSASAAMVLRKYTRRACLPDEYLTVADTLHLPLTRPLRPLREDMESGKEGDEDKSDDDAAMEELEVPPQIVNGDQEVKQEGLIMTEQTGSKIEEETTIVKEEELPSLPMISPVAGVAPSPVPVIAPSSAPAADFDLYADLGADLAIGKGEIAAAPIAVPAPKPATISEPTSLFSDDPAALLNDPAAIASLLQDPVKMQELLQRNPALLVALKAKLGKSRGDGGDAK
jgi:hypothetical protein